MGLQSICIHADIIDSFLFIFHIVLTFPFMGEITDPLRAVSSHDVAGWQLCLQQSVNHTESRTNTHQTDKNITSVTKLLLKVRGWKPKIIYRSFSVTETVGLQLPEKVAA